MARKATKAAQVLELLNKGWSTKQITNAMAVSPSYIWKMKQTMAHKAEEKPMSNGAEDLREMAQDRLDALLDKRAEQYGSFMFSANTAIRLKGVMHNAIAQQDLMLAPDQLLALDMIAVKISRILSGNPSHLDSWIDIAGYAKLVSDRLQGQVR